MSRIALLLTLLTTIVVAQKTTSVSSFLSSDKELINVKDARSLEIQNEKVDFLESSSSNTPFIKNVELRYKADDFTFEEHLFKLRVSPKAWGQTSSGNDLYKSSLEFQKDKINLINNSILRKKYKLVAKMVHYKRALELDSNLLLIYKDKVTIQKQSMGDINFDIDDLIRDEDYITTIQLRLIDINKQIRDLEKKAGVKPGELIFDTKDYISASAINEILTTQKFDIDSTNLYLRNSYLKYELAKSKYKLETSATNKIVSYVDFGYKYDRYPGRTHVVENDFMAGIGINIPIANSKRLSINNRKITLLKEKSDYFDHKRLLEEKISDITKDVAIYNSQLSMLLQRKKEVAKEEYFKNMINISGISPLKLLNIKESIVKTDKKIKDISFEMTKMYIELLDLSGSMSANPLKNYLSSKQEVASVEKKDVEPTKVVSDKETTETVVE